MVNHSRAMVGVIAFALFLDYFLYGLLFPLIAHSHAGLKGEGHLALLYGVYAVSVLLVTPLFGYLGDRIGARSTMLCGVALSIGAICFLGMASTLPLLLLGKFFQGAASAALWTSGLAMIALNYVERRVEMLGYAFTGGTFGSVTGPIAGGLLYQAGGYRLPFLITGIAFAVAGLLIALVVPEGEKHRGDPTDFRALLFNRSMMIPAVAIALAAFSMGIIEPLLPVQLARYGATSMAIGIVFTVSASVYGLSAPLVGRVSERMPIEKVIALGPLPWPSLFRSLGCSKESSW
jgi:DHA1 family solute carrier family 18 vesicular amine transporter 1/2